jgi:hypothetical protein
MSFLTLPPFRVRRWALTSFFSAPLSPRFLLSAPLSTHLLGSVFYNPTSFWVRLWALTFFLSSPLSPRFLLSALLSTHLLGSAFYNPTSFWVRLWAITSFRVRLWTLTSFPVRLWATISWVVHLLTLPPFECTFEPPPSFSRQVTHYNKTILHVFLSV